MTERGASRGPALVLAVLCIAAAALVAVNAAATLPPARWASAAFAPDAADIRELVLHYGLLPRIAVALLCGVGLGLSGALLQQVLRNPLAEPGTLGVFAGARLALVAATLWTPDLLAWGYEPLALAGGAASMGIVLALCRGRRFAPFAVVLAGLIVSLALEAANKMLTIGHYEALSDLLVWQAGSLAQNDWSAAASLAPRIAAATVAALLILRPLGMLDLDEAGARSLGVGLTAMRLGAFAIAVLVSASVVGAVGAIGFIGVAGPAIARAAGARRLGQRIVWGPLISAGLLLLTDQVVAVLGGGLVPTGAVTALLGAPLLLWLVWRMRSTAPGERIESVSAAAPGGWGRVAALALIVIAAAWLALSLGRSPDGWRWATGPEFSALWTWRAPRVGASLAAGFLLAVSGGILQRLSGNPMASPELLGVSAGAALVLLGAAFFAPKLDYGLTLLLAAAGAFAALLLVLWTGRRSGYAPMRMLLIGTGLTALLGSATEMLLATGSPLGAQALTWLAGSTYAATAPQAASACALAVAVALALPLFARWLEILPLGEIQSRSLGLDVNRARLALLALASTLTAASTLLVGPLSFVGLIGPHLARLFGARGALFESVAAGLIGASIMVFADWLGRTLIFPWQIPAGVAATAIGGLYFIWLMRAKR